MPARRVIAVVVRAASPPDSRMASAASRSRCRVCSRACARCTALLSSWSSPATEYLALNDKLSPSLPRHKAAAGLATGAGGPGRRPGLAAGLAAGVQAHGGQTLQRVAARSRGRDGEAVGPDVRARERRPALAGLDQGEQPPLDRLVEAPLGPPAEPHEAQADHHAGNRGPAGVAGDPEGDLAGGQVLDHLVAEAALLKVTVERLVA